MNSLDFHADDYALSKNSDSDIIKLCENGKLNSISIIPNLSIFEYSIELLNSNKKKFKNELKISIHLNFMEGKCVADKKLLPDLVDENSFFTISWGSLLKYNYNPFVYKKIKKQLTTEIIAQIDKTINSGIIDKNHLRIDSHQHTHMIPIVFVALLDAIKIKNYKVDFIRNSQELFRWYIPFVRFYKTYSVINIIKCLILNWYSLKVRKYIKKLSLEKNCLCGVFFSGNMNYSRLKNVLPRITKLQKNVNSKVEILFHPGTMTNDELTNEFTKKGFNEFHLADTRKLEYDALSCL